jgi:hypothetical protein
MRSVSSTAFRSLSIATLLLLPAARAGAVCFALVCPANVTVSNNPDQCGSVVTYPAPLPISTFPGECGTVTCNPPSGSFCPIGTTPVTCNANESCGFDVTVFAQPPRSPFRTHHRGTTRACPVVTTCRRSAQTTAGVVFNASARGSGDRSAGTSLPHGDGRWRYRLGQLRAELLTLKDDASASSSAGTPPTASAVLLLPTRSARRVRAPAWAITSTGGGFAPGPAGRPLGPSAVPPRKAQGDLRIHTGSTGFRS